MENETSQVELTQLEHQRQDKADFIKEANDFINMLKGVFCERNGLALGEVSIRTSGYSTDFKISIETIVGSIPHVIPTEFVEEVEIPVE